MNDWLPGSTASTTCQDDIVTQAEEVRRWWVTEGSREFSDDGTSYDILPCPVTIECLPSGEVASVRFDAGAKANMTDALICDSLKQACRQVRFTFQSHDEGLSLDANLEWISRQVDEITHLLSRISSRAVRTVETQGKNRDGSVVVRYRGGFLSDIKVIHSNWALLSTEVQIQSAIIEASQVALGIEEPFGGLS